MGRCMEARVLGKQSGPNLLLSGQVDDLVSISLSVKWGESHSHMETLSMAGSHSMLHEKYSA